MDLLKTKQVSKEVLDSVEFDLFIAATGFEERCCWLINKFNIQAKKKIALVSSNNHLSLFKNKNTKIFREKNFSFIDISLDENDALVKYFEEFLESNPDKSLNILIDYSGMTKVWYAGIVNLLSAIEDTSHNFQIYFSYTPVEQIKAKKAKPIKVVESLNTPLKSKNSDKKTTLIIGLGIEPGKVDYLREIIKPDKIILMYPDPAYKSYVELLFEVNKDIITEVDMRNMINYPLYDIDRTNEILTNLVLELRLNSNIVIAALGNKSFSLLSMLISLRYPDIEVLKTRTNNIYTEYKKQSISDPIILEAVFTGSDE